MYQQRLPMEWKAKKQAELKETIAAQRSALQEVVRGWPAPCRLSVRQGAAW